MTREEAIEIIENGGWWDLLIPVTTIEGRIEEDKLHEALDMALSALRPVSREQVEKVFPGCEKCRNQANWPSWIEKGFVYCPKCGTPLTSWAWEKQVERLEALKDGDLE